jgi:hypothetical protein
MSTTGSSVTVPCRARLHARVSMGTSGRAVRPMTDPTQPKPGMVLRLTDDQYKFGSGPLLCKVETVITPVQFDGSPWWHLRGECAIGTQDRHGPWHLRELHVVSSAVRAHRDREGQ